VEKEKPTCGKQDRIKGLLKTGGVFQTGLWRANPLQPLGFSLLSTKFFPNTAFSKNY